MKTIILSFVGVLVLIGGTIGVKAVQGHAGQKVDHAAISEQNNDEEAVGINSSTKDFPEITDASMKADLEKYEIEVVEDNSQKRILLFVDKSGQPVYKSILIKDIDVHKVIHLQDGLEEAVVLNENKDTQANEQHVNVDFPELAAIGEEVDVDSYKVKALEDNVQKRILLLEDEQGHSVYKSIYIKKTNKLKLIDLTGKGKTTTILP